MLYCTEQVEYAKVFSQFNKYKNYYCIFTVEQFYSAQSIFILTIIIVAWNLFDNFNCNSRCRYQK